MVTHQLDEARLRELAEAATQGEWKACGTIYEHMNCEIRGGRKGEGQAIAQVWDGPNAFRDGQHIAACSPATILALLDALSAERERGDRAVEAVRARRKLYAWKRDQRDAFSPDTRTEWEVFNTLVEGFDILETEILATQKAEGA